MQEQEPMRPGRGGMTDQKYGVLLGLIYTLMHSEGESADKAKTLLGHAERLGMTAEFLEFLAMMDDPGVNQPA